MCLPDLKPQLFVPEVTLSPHIRLLQQSEDLHTRTGNFAAASGVDRLYLTGNFVHATEKGALQGGMAASDILCGSKNDIFDALKKIIEPKDWVLIKGSRGMRMETLVQALQAVYGTTEKIV